MYFDVLVIIEKNLKKNRYWYIFDIKWVFLVFIVCKILVFFCKILFLCLFFVEL